jgi:hypothetical protein
VSIVLQRAKVFASFFKKKRCLLFCVAVLICARMPGIVLTGRFWCEEGNVFFHNAWVMPPIAALFNSFGGYLNLAANAGTLAARLLLPVALAPYLTITLALLVQLCPPLLLLSARDAWLQPAHVRIAAVLLVLFVPAVEEIWLHTLHCQFHLALCVGIILVLEAEPWRLSWFRYLLLFLAPLCGPGAIALLPLYLVRAALERDRARVWQLAALGLGSALQLGLFYQHEHSRGYALDPVVLLDVFAVRHLCLPFLGIAVTERVAPWVAARVQAGQVPYLATVLPLLVFGPYFVLTLWRRQTRPAFWLLLAGGLVGCASYFGALGGAEGLIHARAGGRYIFVPQALMSLSILALAATATGWVRRGAWLAVAWLLLLGGVEYFHPWAFIAHGPSWRAEVAKWEADPTYRLHVWYASWTPVSLPLHHQN